MVDLIVSQRVHHDFVNLTQSDGRNVFMIMVRLYFNMGEIIFNMGEIIFNMGEIIFKVLLFCFNGERQYNHQVTNAGNSFNGPFLHSRHERNHFVFYNHFWAQAEIHDIKTPQETFSLSSRWFPSVKINQLFF